jgi:hypothetical protein
MKFILNARAVNDLVKTACISDRSVKLYKSFRKQFAAIPYIYLMSQQFVLFGIYPKEVKTYVHQNTIQ